MAVEDNMSFAGFFPIFEISQRVLRRAGSGKVNHRMVCSAITSSNVIAEKKKVLFVHAEFIESEVQAIFRKMVRQPMDFPGVVAVTFGRIAGYCKSRTRTFAMRRSRRPEEAGRPL